MTYSGGAPPPPGWFPDPSGSGRMRWWDGYRWGEQTQDVPGIPGGDPVERALNDERGIARWARHAVWVYALWMVIGGFTAWRLLQAIPEAIETTLSEPSQIPTTPEELLGVDAEFLQLVQLFNSLQLVAFIVLLVWIYRAATTAQRLGIPARRSPGWAVGAWFVPVVNLWWPCQSLRDLLPHGHPTRQRVLVLWLSAVGFGVLAGAGIVLLFFSDAGPGVMAVGYLGMAGVMLLGMPVVTEVLACHEQLAADRTRTAPASW